MKLSLLAAGACALVACSHVANLVPDGGAGTDADADADTDSDTDADSDADDGFAWHTFYGSGALDYATSAIVDGSGNLYVTGYSLETWNGPDNEPPLHAHSGSFSFFVLKLAPDGAYIWHTFYGSFVSPSVDYDLNCSSQLALDGSGNVYVAGRSDSYWEGPSGEPPLHAYSGGLDNGDLFVLKLAPDGAYMWHTFYGSADFDNCTSLAVDGNGNIYLTGLSFATWSGPDGEPPLNVHITQPEPQPFILKLGAEGTYAWHTFFGRAVSILKRSSIAVDGSGNVTVASISPNSWTGPDGGLPLHEFSGGDDLAVLRLDSGGTYVWHTFYGTASGNTTAGSVAVDASGGVWVAGVSNVSWAGPSGEPPLHAASAGGNYDLFALKLESDGAYVWHTFYGSADSDSGGVLRLDGSGSIYVTGSSNSSWSGSDGEAAVHSYSGNEDLFVLELGLNGAYEWHSFYGSGQNDQGRSLALDGNGNVYVTGQSESSWDGPGGAPPLHAHSGDFDLFVLKRSI